MRDFSGHFLAKMRRGHRLHSIEGIEDLDNLRLDISWTEYSSRLFTPNEWMNEWMTIFNPIFKRFNKSESALNYRDNPFEVDLIDLIRNENLEKLQTYKKEGKFFEHFQKNFEFVHRCAKECVQSDNQDLIRQKNIFHLHFTFNYKFQSRPSSQVEKFFFLIFLASWTFKGPLINFIVALKWISNLFKMNSSFYF